ncbi:hypothetical protein MishRS11D_18540 [Methylomagnum ishizawai]|nr:hypothetical protein MishRS11D_18540 [Methylomagnum ishizawai]
MGGAGGFLCEKRGADLTVEHNQTLVSARLPPEPPLGHFQDDPEPAFVVPGSAELTFPREYHAALSDYFRHCIARDPNDLRSHVRRIYLEHEAGRGEELHAALLDLFIALGRRGAGLRRRMLELARDTLDPRLFQELAGAFAQGVDAIHTPIVPGSILSRGIEGGLNLVHPAGEPRGEGPRDVLLEAREYLEYSQVEEARALLERAVLREPLRAELHLELLDIYRSTRDSANFSRLSEALEGIEIAVPEAWQALTEYFRSLND